MLGDFRSRFQHIPDVHRFLLGDTQGWSHPQKGARFWMVKVHCLRSERIARRNPAPGWCEKPISVFSVQNCHPQSYKWHLLRGGYVWCLGAVCSFEATDVLNRHLRVGCFYGNLRKQKARWETILPAEPLDPLDFVLNPQPFQKSIWFIQKIDSLWHPARIKLDNSQPRSVWIWFSSRWSSNELSRRTCCSAGGEHKTTKWTPLHQVVVRSYGPKNRGFWTEYISIYIYLQYRYTWM